MGNGFYIWENNYKRAFQWALDKQARGILTTPSVVGVVYLLDSCLDFTDSEFIDLLPSYYESMKEDLRITGKELPINKDLPKDIYHDLILRELDSAVIEYLHQKIEERIKSEITAKGHSKAF